MSGFGTTPDHTPIMFAPGVLTFLWGGQVKSLADGLGVELDDVRERRETWVTPDPIECTMMARRSREGWPRSGSRSRVSWRRCLITMEHVNRLTDIRRPGLAVSA